MSLNGDEKLSLEKILSINLAAKKGEKFFVLVNNPDSFSGMEKNKVKDLLEMGEYLVEAGRKNLIDIRLVKFPAMANHGMEPDETVWNKLLPDFVAELKKKRLFNKLLTKKLTESEKDVVVNILESLNGIKIDGVIALSYYSTTHTFFRKFLTETVGTRYASMPLFEKYMLTGSMNADYSAIKARCDKIVDLIDGSVKVNITAPNGTDLSFDVEGRKFIKDHGLLVEKGLFGNLPAGEVFTAPVEGSANGIFVIEYGPEDGKLESPIEAVIENGNVVKLNGKGRWVDFLNNKFKEDNRCRNIAELGIGTNEGATHTENILEAEKILGTLHVAFGDNSSFGGKIQAPLHVDFVLFEPELVFTKGDGSKVTLLEKGKLLV